MPSTESNEKKDTNQERSLTDENEPEDETDSWIIPLPSMHKSPLQRPTFQKHPLSDNHDGSSSTPLLPVRRRNHRSQQQKPKGNPVTTSFNRLARLRASNILFGGDNDDPAQVSERRRPEIPSTSASMSYDGDNRNKENRPHGISAFFFGFMYEEPFDESMEYETEDEDNSRRPPIWNPLNLALFATFSLTTTATAAPVFLLGILGQTFHEDSASASAFASRAAASAVLGTACGKFLNGPVGDVWGARRTMVCFSGLLAVSLVGLSLCTNATWALWACFFVEFCQSVQWPCILILLATHYQHSRESYEGGIFIASVASRFGALWGIPSYSWLLGSEEQQEQQHQHWRVICWVGAWSAMIGCSVAYLFLQDSPIRVNDPQNPLPSDLLLTHFKGKTQHYGSWNVVARVVHSVAADNLWPSLKHVVKSGTFWIVALAHTGSSMIRTSERILATYLFDTSNGSLSESQASGYTIFCSLGTIAGLSMAGRVFTNCKEQRQRKWLVSRLYVVVIGSCYLLAILAIPSLRRWLDAPGLVLAFQVMASFAMSFGISIMLYQLPGLVGSAFGNHKGLFAAYLDGVAYAMASVVWKIVANSVAGGGSGGSGGDELVSSSGGGWAYGWAAVALLLILCGILMVEFMEHYFVRASGRHHGSYETIVLA